MNSKLLALFCFGMVLLRQVVVAQDYVPKPEQDCFGALPVCQLVTTADSSYQGRGTEGEVNPNNSCLENGENNSSWFTFTISDSGMLEFSIIPHAQDDYDFALYNLTGRSCEDIYTVQGIEVRCSYAFSLGPTGLKPGYNGTSSPPQDTAAFLAPLAVFPGQTFALMIDNFNTSTDGFTLDFTNSTAGIFDDAHPKIDSIKPLTCDSTGSILVLFSERIACNTLPSGTNNFTVSGPSAVSVTQVTIPDCHDGLTDRMRVHFAAPIRVAGTYSLLFTPTVPVVDRCGNQFAADTLTFYSPAGINVAFSSECLQTPAVNFMNTTEGNNLSYLWDFGDGNTSSLENPSHTYTPGTYSITLTASNNSCTVTTAPDSIIVVNSFVTDFTYSPSTIYRSDLVYFSNQSSPGSYEWSVNGLWWSTQTNASYTFFTPDSYNVCLIARMSCYSDTTCKSITVFDSPTPVAMPAAESASIDVFPNPTDHSLLVRLVHFKETTGALFLYNLLGEEVLQQEVTSDQLDLNLGTVPSGIYLLKVQTKSSLQVREIVKL